ncbi:MULTISPECIES: hypothetical protein [Bradyrhizobium]|uniref:hypothetical protein n=1 Tax=Bradyrhizobium elkanii TaxID=29448 RepID=UPI0003F9B81D|nr:hypothetical protein [Bradyrhizobium elkanii]
MADQFAKEIVARTRKTLSAAARHRPPGTDLVWHPVTGVADIICVAQSYAIDD